MARRPCPTGGKDGPDGSFCGACGVYKHSALSRAGRRVRAPTQARGMERPMLLGLKGLAAGACALLLFSALLRRPKAVPEAPKAQASHRVESTRTIRVSRSSAWSIQAQAAANRRLDEIQRSLPAQPQPDPKEERRRKKRLARMGLGL